MFSSGRSEASSAISTPRPEASFFLHPSGATHRRYEVLRAYFVDARTAGDVAGAFGYTPETVRSMVRDFRAGRRDFFSANRTGPRRAPAKDAARPRIVVLRRRGLSLDEIARVLSSEGTPLNRSSIAEVLVEERLPPLRR